MYDQVHSFPVISSRFTSTLYISILLNSLLVGKYICDCYCRAVYKLCCIFMYDQVHSFPVMSSRFTSTLHISIPLNTIICVMCDTQVTWRVCRVALLERKVGAMVYKVTNKQAEIDELDTKCEALTV